MKLTTQHSSFTIILKFIGRATVKIYHGAPYGWICVFWIFSQQPFGMKEMCKFVRSCAFLFLKHCSFKSLFTIMCTNISKIPVFSPSFWECPVHFLDLHQLNWINILGNLRHTVLPLPIPGLRSTAPFDHCSSATFSQTTETSFCS